MSTDAAPNLSTPRGQHDFDPAALRGVLAQAEASRPLGEQELAQYRRFYGLQFADIPHRHELFCIDADGERLVVQYYIPDQARGHVFMCHGYFDHVGLFAYVIAGLMQRGLAVVTYDQIGHGLSTGAPGTIENFDRYVAATRAVWLHAHAQLQPTRPWHWLGQSMGGAIVMEYLHQHPPAVDEQAIGDTVLLAPLVRPYAWGINRWVFAIAKYTIKQRARTLTNNAENAEFLDLQKVDPLQAQALPVAWVAAMVEWSARFIAYPESQLAPKMVQGDNDRTVDAKFGVALYKRRYPNSRFLILPGGRHHLANESAPKRAQMWAFLDEHCDW